MSPIALSAGPPWGLGLGLAAGLPAQADARIDLPPISVLGRFSDSPVAAGIVIGLLILSLALHELAHAWTADRLGDPTAREAGRLTANPLAHLDPFLSVLLPAILILAHSPFVFGGAKPVPVVMQRLRNPWRDMMLVALAGPVTNVLLGLGFLLAWKVSVYSAGYSRYETLPTVLAASMYINWILAVFNMLPIPPLDGSRVMAYLLPAGDIRRVYVGLERFGLLLVVLVLMTGVLNDIVIGALYPMRDFFNGLTGGRWIL